MPKAKKPKTAVKSPESSVGVALIRIGDWGAFAKGLDPRARAAATLAQFTCKAGELALIGDDKGRLSRVLFGLGANTVLFFATGSRFYVPNDFGFTSRIHAEACATCPKAAQPQ